MDLAVLATVALGGVIGSLGRYAVGVALPHRPGAFPWATLVVNVTGAFAMGLLVAYLVDRPGAHRLARPFVGVGVLGGWTTFSALAVDVVQLGARRPGAGGAGLRRGDLPRRHPGGRRGVRSRTTGLARPVTLANALLVALGAAVGAPLRYLANHGVREHLGGTPAAGTLVVNVVGSFVLGVLVGAGARQPPRSPWSASASAAP